MPRFPQEKWTQEAPKLQMQLATKDAHISFLFDLISFFILAMYPRPTKHYRMVLYTRASWLVSSLGVLFTNICSKISINPRRDHDYFRLVDRRGCTVPALILVFFSHLSVQDLLLATCAIAGISMSIPALTTSHMLIFVSFLAFEMCYGQFANRRSVFTDFLRFFSCAFT